MKNRSYILTGFGIGALLIGYLLFTTGCLQIHLLGGRSISVNQYASGGDTLASTPMEAPSQTSDILNEFMRNARFPTQVGPKDVPAIPDLSDSPDEPPSSDGSTSLDPAAPADSDGESDVPPPIGDDTFLWKPVSETTGNLVVLTPASLEGVRASYAGSTAAAPTRNGKNGNRQHWRFGKPGSAFGAGTFTMELKGGGTVSWQIASPGSRYTAPIPNVTPAPVEEPDQPGGETVKVMYEPPHLVLPDVLDVTRVALHIDGRAVETGRAVPVSGNVAVVPTEWLGQPALLAQVHTRQDEALYEMTFDPREPWLQPFTVIYTKGWMQWTAAIPQDGYVPTAEQATNRQSTKWRFQG